MPPRPMARPPVPPLALTPPQAPRRPLPPLAPQSPQAAPRRPMPPLAPTPLRRALAPLATSPGTQAPPSLRRPPGRAPKPARFPPGLWPARVFGRHPVTREVVAVQRGIAGYFQIAEGVNPTVRNQENGVPEEVAQAVIETAFREPEDGGTVWAGASAIDWEAME